MISPISGTSSTKQTSKQNLTRDIENKNKLTVTRGEVGRDSGAKRGKGFQEHLQRTHGQNQRGLDQGWVVGMAGVWGSGREMETTVLEQQ